MLILYRSSSFLDCKREYNNREIYLIKTRELTVIGVTVTLTAYPRPSRLAGIFFTLQPESISIARNRDSSRRLFVKNNPASPHQNTFVYIYMNTTVCMYIIII